MLQRVYGTCFPTQEELDEYLKRLEEAKKRDHRKIGKEMDLFALYDEAPGFPFFLPKGMIIRNELENFWKMEHRKRAVSYTHLAKHISGCGDAVVYKYIRRPFWSRDISASKNVDSSFLADRMEVYEDILKICENMFDNSSEQYELSLIHILCVQAWK